jgi:CRP-like cAMP-binding protein
MVAAVPGEGTRVRVLEALPELGEDLGGEDLRLARQHLVADLITLRRCRWRPLAAYQQGPGHLGLLILDGLLTRDVILGQPLATELVGRGDLLRPADRDGDAISVPFEISWTVLAPVRMAVLDAEVTKLVGHWPSVVERILRGASDRVHALAIASAVSRLPRIDLRVLVMLWYLADRWGRVRPDGVHLPLRLTHEVIARMVGARRPTVSGALKALRDEGQIVVQPDRTWLLVHRPNLLTARTPSVGSQDPAMPSVAIAEP